jgi:hypothetical protein
MTKPQLSADDERDLRDAASDAWKQPSGRFFPHLRARMLFQSDPRVQRIAKLDPATIALFLQVAVMLWQWWRDNKISEPSVVAMSGEPCFAGVPGDYE